jgi:hypothetical protein
MVAVVEDTLEQQMEGRIARLESDVTHMRTDIADLKADHRQLRDAVTALSKFVCDMRDEMHTSFARVDGRFDKLESKIDRKSLQDRLWMGGLILTALMAHGFKWL